MPWPPTRKSARCLHALDIRKSAAVLSRRDLEGALYAVKIASDGTASRADLPRVALHAPN
jgi:hypothetical protein